MTVHITPDPNNANKGTQRGRGLLEKSLRQYGAGRSVLADKNGMLIAGNKTAEVAQELVIPYRVVETDGHELIVVQRNDLDLAFCDGRRAGDIVRLFGAPSWVFGWDGVTSWYTPNRPLQRMKLCFWYGDVATFDLDGAHYGDAGKTRPVSNSRGAYTFVPDPRGKHLTDLFVEPITVTHAETGPSHAKPVDWIRLLVADCTSEDVFDPFVGSGTSIVACEQVGNRTCLAMEIDPAMAAVTLERLAGLGLQPERVA